MAVLIKDVGNFDRVIRILGLPKIQCKQCGKFRPGCVRTRVCRACTSSRGGIITRNNKRKLGNVVVDNKG